MHQSLSVIKALLASRGIHPRKRFGQNFLHDANKLKAILTASEPGRDQTVLEVGPGTGALTEPLLAAGARVIAVEIDRDMCAILRERIGDDSPQFTLFNLDVMDGKHRINQQVAAHLHAHPFSLVANLPYNIASPLLATMACDYPTLSHAVVMIQKEVAERLVARHGGKDYGPISVIIQAMCTHEWIATLSPHCFWPEPQVESAVIKLKRRERPLTAQPRKLSQTLQTLFSKRRKQIGSILGRGTRLPPGIEPTLRPEQLTVEQLVAISESTEIERTA